MSTAEIIRELEQLPLAEKLLVIESTLKSIRTAGSQPLAAAVDSLYHDYKNDPDLTTFTQLDTEDFYVAR